MLRTRLFIDYWNFHIDWIKRTNNAPMDWTRVPAVFVQAASEQFAKAGLGLLSLDETRVYASYEPNRDGNLRGWLHNFFWIGNQVSASLQRNVTGGNALSTAVTVEEK